MFLPSRLACLYTTRGGGANTAAPVLLLVDACGQRVRGVSARAALEGGAMLCSYACSDHVQWALRDAGDGGAFLCTCSLASGAPGWQPSRHSAAGVGEDQGRGEGVHVKAALHVCMICMRHA